MIHKTLLHNTAMTFLLVGAVSLPVASMANDAAGFPRLRAPLILPLTLVQETGSEGQSPERHERHDVSPVPQVDYAVPAADAEGISAAQTAVYVAALSDGTSFCQAMRNPAYNVDCLSDQMEMAAKAMAETGGYAEARKALMDGSARLHALAMANRVYGKPAALAKIGGKKSSRLLTPVANPAAVNAAAAAIVEDTKLVLLRSSSGSNQRRLAYSQIAAVMNSTKFLLRSA
ncbi:MAG: hypothetical protein ACOH2H_12365 [Cypionkella sp.]